RGPQAGQLRSDAHAAGHDHVVDRRIAQHRIAIQLGHCRPPAYLRWNDRGFPASDPGGKAPRRSWCQRDYEPRVTLLDYRLRKLFRDLVKGPEAPSWPASTAGPPGERIA